MKKSYFLLSASLLALALPAAAQRPWRPFQPGLIYTYHAVPATAEDAQYTLRVDSAYAAPNGDSVYVFNRLMRNRYAGTGSGPYYFYKSRNNQFGKQVRWQPGQRSYTLEATSEANLQNASSVELRPQAAIGSTWLTGTGTATLISRSWETITPAVQDTVAVISLSNGAGGTAQTVRLSRLHGLLAAPQWLGAAVSAPAPVMLEQAAPPVRHIQSVYSALNFFNLQPGDEFGYEQSNTTLSGFQCGAYYRLRRVVSRRQTADSLLIGYLEQNSSDLLAGGPCGSGPAGVTFSPITTHRWAIALAGNTLQPAGDVFQLGILQLLTGEYASVNVTPTYAGQLIMGMPIASGTALVCAPGTRAVRYMPLFPAGGANQFQPGVDAAGGTLDYSPGVTRSRERGFRQTYARRIGAGGQVVLCGSNANFRTLLPARAAQTAAAFSLYPNPAREAATLQLREPAREGSTMQLRDALGRAVWQGSLSAGQRSAEVPLAGLPAGIYLVQLGAPGEAPLSLRLVKE